jgi:hypothetical protein
MLLYGPNKPNGFVVDICVSFSTASMVVRGGGEKLNGEPLIGQSMCWGYSREFLFIESTDFVRRTGESDLGG